MHAYDYYLFFFKEINHIKKKNLRLSFLSSCTVLGLPLFRSFFAATSEKKKNCNVTRKLWNKTFCFQCLLSSPRIN